jgi:hypothetical protein
VPKYTDLWLLPDVELLNCFDYPLLKPTFTFMNFFYKHPIYIKIFLMVIIISTLHNIAHLKETVTSTHDVAYKAGELTALLLKLVAIVKMSLYLINDRKLNAA